MFRFGRRLTRRFDQSRRKGPLRGSHRALPDLREFLIGWTQATPTAALFRASSDPMRDRFIAYLMERFASFVDDGGVAILHENHYLK